MSARVSGCGLRLKHLGRKMRMNQRRFLGLGISILGVLVLSRAVVGQVSKESEAALPTDWSHHHLIFSKPAFAGLTVHQRIGELGLVARIFPDPAAH